MNQRIGQLVSILVLLGAASPARGASWEPDPAPISASVTNATLGAGGRSASVDPAGNIHLVFQRNLDADHFEVYHLLRDPTGVWSDPELLSGSGNGRNASLTADLDGRTHVVWEDITAGEGDIAYRSRNPDGSWSETQTLFPAPGFSKQPTLAVDAANVLHVVWIDARLGTQRVYHTSVPAAGGSWNPPTILGTAGTFPEYPDLAADGLGVVHLFWAERGTADDTRFSYSIQYAKLEGGTISPVQALIQHGKVARRPHVAALADGTLHLVWLDDRVSTQGQVFEVFYKRFLPGLGWGKDKRFTYDGNDHGRPVIAPGPENTMNLAWEDYRAGTPDIVYRQIRPETGWDRDPTPLTGDPSSSQSPGLVVLDDGRMLLFWSDAQSSGTLQVFAREGTIGSAP